MDNLASNEPVADLAAVVQQQWSAQMADRCVMEVGLSGGLDSMVLLHVLYRLQAILPLRVSAVHVHHGLQPAADDWLWFCQHMCAQWQIPLRVEKVNVSAPGRGPEAAARAARYAVFAASRAQAVVLAHHRDDQVETFMLAALRGGGLRALAAMPAQRWLTDMLVLWRPLLPFTRVQLQAYARVWQLPFVNDSSNQDTRLLRNWLRWQGLPPWRAHLPQLVKQISSSVAALQDELALVDEVRRQDWQRLVAAGYFDVHAWRLLSPARQCMQLHYFAEQHHLGVPSRRAVHAFARQLRMVDIDQGQWPLPHGSAVLYRHVLWPQQAEACHQWPWLAALPCVCTMGATVPSIPLRWASHAMGLPANIGNLNLRCVNADDVLQLKNGRKNVKKMLQERRIPAFMRNIWPILINQQGCCVAVVNVAVAVDMAVSNGQMPLLDGLPLRMRWPNSINR